MNEPTYIDAMIRLVVLASVFGGPAALFMALRFGLLAMDFTPKGLLRTGGVLVAGFMLFPLIAFCFYMWFFWKIAMRMTDMMTAFFPPVGLLGYLLVPASVFMMVTHFVSDFSTLDAYPTEAVKRIEVSRFGDRLELTVPQKVAVGDGIFGKETFPPKGDVKLVLRGVRVSDGPEGGTQRVVLDCLARSMRQMQDTLTTTIFEGLAPDDARRIYQQARTLTIREPFPRDVILGEGGVERIKSVWEECADTLNR